MTRTDDAPVASAGREPPPGPLILTLGHEELVIRRRYEAVSIVNDMLIAVWFLVGSLLAAVLVNEAQSRRLP